MKWRLRNRESRSSRASSSGSSSSGSSRGSSSGGSGRMENPSAWLIKELTATFKVFDKDGNGSISRSELEGVLRSLGDSFNESELNDLMARLGGSDGCISLEQFISFHTDSVARPSSAGRSGRDLEMDSLMSAFAVFDIDRNGFISAEELQAVMLSLGDKHTSLEECRHMIKCVDTDGNQMVDFGEFRRLMSGSCF